VERPGPRSEGRGTIGQIVALRVLSLSVAGLLIVPAAWFWSRQPMNVGSLERVTVGPAPVHRTEEPVSVAPGVPVPQIEVHSARLADWKPPARDPAPVRLRIDAIGVNAAVVPVGVAGRSGTTEVPQDVGTVGWYRFGPTPGQEGSSVLLGHVDDRAQGPGAFFRLVQVGPGDSVVVTAADGTRWVFEVVARRSYPKNGLPPSVFDRLGRPSVALVTCGGDFDWRTRTYSDNVVVFAVPKR
jgi:sortase (surface protein transpeptidase)